jgi:hypothetical protein
MAQESTQQIRIVMSNEEAAGRVSASLSAFLAFDRELTQQTAMLVQRWLYWAPPNVMSAGRGAQE